MKVLAGISLILCTSWMGVAQDSLVNKASKQLYEAELNFANMANEQGAKEAFLMYLAPESIGFDATTGMPTNAKEEWSKKEMKGLLTWKPFATEITASADLGVTTRAWKLFTDSTQTTVQEGGSHLCLWQKTPSNTWQVLLDIGVNHTVINPDNCEEYFPVFKPEALTNGQVLAERFAFMNDHFYWKNAKTSTNPYEPHLDEKVVLFRDGITPIIGKKKVLAFLEKNQDKSLVYTGLKAIASKSGDLACVYGIVSGKTKQGKPLTGTYVRIWKQEAKGVWKITQEVVKIAK